METYCVSLVVSYFPGCGCGVFVSMHLKEGFPHTDIIVWFQCRKTFTWDLHIYTSQSSNSSLSITTLSLAIHMFVLYSIPSVFICLRKGYLFPFEKIFFLGIVFLIEIFFFQYFEYIMPFSPGLQGFAEKFPDRIMVILLHRTNKFSIASFKILFVLYFRYFDYNMSQHHLLWVDCIWGHLIFLVWFSIFPPKIWKIFSQFLFKSMSLF